MYIWVYDFNLMYFVNNIFFKKSIWGVGGMEGKGDFWFYMVLVMLCWILLCIDLFGEICSFWEYCNVKICN